ncbi:DoxX family protein [bacterium]|nr:DoxX family protein [bacterium]
METIRLALQVIVAFGLLNVWLLRSRKPSPYRGKGAKSMGEEFAAYGLPKGAMWVVGALKVSVAMALLLGIWIPWVVFPAATLLILLMVGAFVMHLKVRDPFERSIPSLLMLAMGIALIVV